jgi:DNA-binding response OmpR family regulator
VATVLVIERDPLHLELMTFLLKQDGHRTFTALDGKVAFEILQAYAVDLVTIETAQPHHDGVRLCQQIRKLNPLVPIIIVSERGELDQIVRGLTTAADDYLTKPFSPHEFLARVRALLRRASLSRGAASMEDTSLAIGDVLLDQQHMTVVVNGVRVSLTPRELSLLRVFMENPDRVLSRDQLLQLAWGDKFVATAKAIDVYVLRLRQKIRPHLREDFYIRSLRGFGYVFAVASIQGAARGADAGKPREAPHTAIA